MRKALLNVFLLCLFSAFGLNQLQAALNGAYTINGAAPASATNYVNFASAFSDLNSGTRSDGGTPNGAGVTGPVVFTVAAGTYAGNVSLTAVTGASSTNTITFDGVNPATRIITANTTTVGGFTVQLNGADFVRFQNLTFENTGASYGYGLSLINGANDNQITGCVFNLPANASGTYQAGLTATTLYTAYGNYANNTLVENNSFNGGRYGLVMNGQTTTQATGNVIRNNTFRNSYMSGIWLSYQANVLVELNDVETGTYTSSYGIYIRNSNEFVIRRNLIKNTGTYGLYCLSANPSSFNAATIENNMIGGSFKTTSTSYALYLSSCNYINLYHNSILADCPSGTNARGIYSSGGVGFDFRNNSIAAVAPSGATSTYAIYASTASAYITLNYNNYYSDGSNLVYFQGNQLNMGIWTSNYPAHNANSQVNWPNYISSTDLHTSGPVLNNWATNIAAITTDFDGQTRPLAPDVVKDVGADELVVAPIDLDLNSILSPLVLAVGSNTVSVEARNNGSGSLNGIPTTLQYSTDGGTTWVGTQTFTPVALGTPGNTETFTFSLPWNVTTPGTYNLCVRVSPVLVGDPDASDQICNTACTGMSGNYTINGALATGGTNFNTFADAVNALATCGIGASVRFNVAAGTYNEQVSLPAILGTSSTSRVTFDGAVAANCTLSYNISSTNQAVLQLDGADYVTFKNMTISSPGLYGFGVHLTNQADDDSLVGLKINLNPTSTSVYHIGILTSGATYSTYTNSANNLVVDGCHITGGYYGMRITGISSTAYCTNNTVQNCTVEDFYYYGIFLYYQDAPKVRNNTISGDLGFSSTGSNGIYMYYADNNYEVINNEVFNVGTRGLYLYYGNNSGTGYGQVHNNKFAGTYTGSTCYGMYIYNTRKSGIYHNSVNLCGANGYPLYVNGSTGLSDSLRIKNNIFQGTNTYAVYIIQPSHITEMDHNLYFTSGPTQFYFGTAYTNLAAWQTAYPAMNANSVFDQAGFISCSNLNIVCSPADNLGTPVGILTDINGNARSNSTPDVGASEFTSISVSLDLGNDTTHCGMYVLVADTNAFQSFVWNTGSVAPGINVDTTSTWSVVATDSNNCRASDTINIVILANPTPYYNSDTISICNTDSLDAQNPGSSYLWNTGATTQVIYTAGPGVYSVEITSIDGCVEHDTVTVDWFATAGVNLGPDQTFCLGGAATLNAGSQPTGSIFTWSSGASTQVSVVSAPGTYYVDVVTPNGCTASDTVVVNALLPPVVNLGADQTVCSPITLDAGNPGAIYAWNTGASTSTINVTTTGSYIVNVTNSAGCTESDTVQITVSTGPAVNTGPNQVLCNGQTVTLNAGVSGMQYAWSNGANTQTITVSSPGTYIVVVTDPNTGCNNQGTVSVSSSFLSVNLGPDQPLCSGVNAVLDAGSGATTYSWSTGASTQTISVNTPGTYTVTVTDNLGCTATDQIVLAAPSGITAAFNAPTVAPLFSTVQFTDNSTGGAISWFWDFGDGTSSTLQNPSHNFVAMGPTTVCLTVSDGTCPHTTCQNLTVQAPIGIDDELFAQGVKVYPNPNNGRFAIGFELEDFENIAIELFSLTGQVVYQSQMEHVLNTSVDVDVTGIASGIYMLKVSTESQKVLYKKLIVE